MCKKGKSTMEEKSQSLIPLKAKLWQGGNF